MSLDDPPKFSPSMKRFNKRYLPIADAIASVNIDQEEREAVAQEVAHAIEKAGSRDFPDFRPDLFVLLASDPLVPCAGPPGSVCPHGRMMRMRFHNSASPDGRSLLWQRRAPYGKIRCVSCGGPQFSIPTKGAA